MQIFHLEAETVAKNKGKTDTLEAMARISDKASQAFSGDWGDMMRALGLLFIGTPETGPGTLVGADKLQSTGDLSNYYLGSYFRDAGFNVAYQDGENQIGHVWGFIANTTVLQDSYHYKDAADIESIIANNGHEFTERGSGGSRQDFILSRAGMALGTKITNGVISPYELGDALRTNLGDDASVNYIFVWQYWALPDAQE